ncbi:MAG TPA: hypothetical protein GX747_02640, partial [Tenericutes bacterium]|nr:hypothetical protein [Mycoplasmatota bacterium]
MNKKCSGCGSFLQNESIDKEGYIKDISKDNCERCFRITNYGDYKQVVKTNDEYINILTNINKTKDLVILVVDIFNINKDLSHIRDYIDNDILLVINKRDILPRSIYDIRLIEYFNSYNLDLVDKVLISSSKNSNFDELMDKIIKHKKSK